MECWLKDRCNGKDCDKFCLRKYKLDYLYNEALLSESQKRHLVLKVDDDGTDFEEFKRLANIATNVTDFVNEHQNLYIHSSTCGNGKSSWAIRIIESYLDKIWASSELTCRVLFISVPRFLLASKDKISAKSEYFDHIKENYLDADIVVWDDIFHKSISEYEYSQLLSLIENRLSAGKTNIFTSNISPEIASTITDARLISRIANTAIQIELHGTDKRNITANKDNKW